MNILFTAFKGAYNTSFQLVDRIGRTSLLLTNSFSGLEKDIDSLENNYNAVYMFGVDKNLKGRVRIEKCAQNGERVIYTDFDILTLSEQMADCNILYQISNTPTRYLCNFAYYHMLCKNKDTVFIHIPSIRGMDDGLKSKLINLFTGI